MIFQTLLCIMFVLCFVLPVFAEEKEEKLEEIVVEEKRIIKEKSSLSLSAESLPANVNVLTKEDISNLVTPRHEEIFRKIPGLYVENYGQGDIGSALTMRGLGGGGGGKKNM